MRQRLRTRNGNHKVCNASKYCDRDSGPKIQPPMSNSLDKMPPQRRERASRFSLILGFAISAFYVILSKGSALGLFVLSMVQGRRDLMMTGFHASQFDQFDKIIVALILGTSALCALVFRFPEIRTFVVDLIGSISRHFEK